MEYFAGGLFVWMAVLLVYIWRVVPPPWPLPLVIGTLIAVLAGGGFFLIFEAWYG